MRKSLFFWLFFMPHFLFAQSQQSEAEIEANMTLIKQKISALKLDLNKAYGEEKIIVSKLEAQDKAINSVSLKVKKSNEQLLKLQAEVSQTSEEIKSNTKKIATQKNQIIDLLKLNVYLNHDKTLKMLLINPDNHQNDQTKHQIKFLQNRLYLLIEEVAVKVGELEKLKVHFIEMQKQEENKKNDLLSQQNTLMEERKKRVVILNELKDQIKRFEREGNSLDKDHSRLQKLLNEIKVLLSDLPKDLGLNKKFDQLKRAMKKPIDGKYIRSFRSKRSENTKWNGVVIDAKLGDDIKSIAYGRVAFADWLRGFGMLVIIDHQDGYMSLYGFNESIIVEVGDWVDSRQIIATAGNSGTLDRPALYFEIRKDAKPLNPKLWVR